MRFCSWFAMETFHYGVLVVKVVELFDQAFGDPVMNHGMLALLENR
jgi:hypothetical protein